MGMAKASTCPNLWLGPAVAVYWLLVVGECQQLPATWLIKQRGGGSHDKARAVAVDASDAVYVAGSTESNDFDGQPYGGDTDVALVKYNHLGSWQWTRVLGSNSVTDIAEGVAVSSAFPDGSVFVAGYHKRYGMAQVSIQLHRYTFSGNLGWSLVHSPSGMYSKAFARAIVVNSAGSAVFVAGYGEGSWDSQSNMGGEDTFVMRFAVTAADCTHEWTRFRGSSQSDRLSRLAIDGNSLYAAGMTKGSFDSQANAVTNREGCLLIKYDTSGVWQWTRIRNSAKGCFAHDISTDPTLTLTDLYVAGWADAAIDGQEVLYGNPFIGQTVALYGAHWTGNEYLGFRAQSSDIGPDEMWTIADEGNGLVSLFNANRNGWLSQDGVHTPVGLGELWTMADVGGGKFTLHNAYWNGYLSFNGATNSFASDGQKWQIEKVSVGYCGWAVDRTNQNQVNCQGVMQSPPGSIGGCTTSECLTMTDCMNKCNACTSCRAFKYSSSANGSIRCYMLGDTGATSYAFGEADSSWRSYANERDTGCKAKSSPSGIQATARFFFVDDLGKIRCDPGRRINDELTCEAAAIQLGKAYAVSLNSEYSPEDCYDNGANELYFNTASTGGSVSNRAPICIQAANAGLVASQSKSSILMKYDSDGNWQWTRIRGTAVDDDSLFNAVYANRRRDGGIYAAGTSKQSIDGQSLTGGDGKGNDMLVMRYSDAGDWTWSKLLGTPSTEKAVAATMDSTGRIVVVGYSTGDMTTGGNGNINDFVFVSAAVLPTTTTTTSTITTTATTTSTTTTTTIHTTTTTPTTSTSTTSTSTVIIIQSTTTSPSPSSYLITSTTTSSSTTTLLTSGLMQGAITLNISRASDFVKEPEAPAVIGRAIAEMLQVNESWVQNVTITVLPNRRLQFLTSSANDAAHDTRGRRMSTIDVTTKHGIKVEFDVVIPPDGGPGQLTATMLTDRFDQTSLNEATEVLNRVVKSGALGSTDYEVTVVVKRIATVSEPPTPAPAPAPPSEDNQDMVMMAIVSIAAACAALACLLPLVFYLRRREKNLKYRISESFSKLMEHRDFAVVFSDSQLLFPPDAVTTESKESLCSYISGMLDSSKPNVFVSFSIGNRSMDANDAGPGLFFAAAVIKALRQHDISCYTLLPDTLEYDRCLELLSSQDTPCKLLLILETRALYSCRTCLEHIHCAQKSNIDSMRLRFEAELSVEEMQWDDIAEDDIEHYKMRKQVESALESKLAAPDDPDTVQTIDCFLDTFAFDLKRKLKAMKTYGLMKSELVVDTKSMQSELTATTNSSKPETRKVAPTKSKSDPSLLKAVSLVKKPSAQSDLHASGTDSMTLDRTKSLPDGKDKKKRPKKQLVPERASNEPRTPSPREAVQKKETSSRRPRSEEVLQTVSSCPPSVYGHTKSASSPGFGHAKSASSPRKKKNVSSG